MKTKHGFVMGIAVLVLLIAVGISFAEGSVTAIQSNDDIHNLHTKATTGVWATVIFQFGNQEVLSATVLLPPTNTTGIKATELACQNLSLNLHYTWSTYGAFVDTIGWDTNQWPGAYWHLLVWNNDSYQWELSSVGASSINLKNGDVIAWIYTEDYPSTYSPMLLPGMVPGHYTAWPAYRGNINNTGYVHAQVLGRDLIWQYKGQYSWGFSATPAVGYGMIFAADGSAIYALTSSGTEIWNNSAGASVTSSPAITDKYVVIGNSTGYLVAFYKNNGTIAWKYKVSNNSWGVSSSPVTDVYDGKNIAFIGTYETSAPWGYFYAINMSNGAVIWNITLNSGVYFGTPAIYKGKIYIPLAGRYNTSTWSFDPPYGLICVDESNGTLVWNFTTTSPVKYSPAVEDNTVYLTSGNTIFALNATSGALKWNITLEGTLASPAVHSGVIYVGSSINSTAGVVYSVSTNGTVLWNSTVSGPVQSGVVIANDTILFSTNSANGTVYCYYLNGTLAWKYTPTPSGYILATPVISDSTVLIASNSGYIYAIGNNATMPIINGVNVSNAYVNKYIKVFVNATQVYQALLYYKNITGTEWHCVYMNYTGTGYSGYIPPQSTPGNVDYYVVLVDTSGNTRASPLYTAQVVSLVPEFSALYLVAVMAIAMIVVATKRKL